MKRRRSSYLYIVMLVDTFIFSSPATGTGIWITLGQVKVILSFVLQREGRRAMRDCGRNRVICRCLEA